MKFSQINEHMKDLSEVTAPINDSSMEQPDGSSETFESNDWVKRWKAMKQRDRVEQNSRLLKQSVVKWNTLVNRPISISNTYGHYLVFMHIPKAGGTTLQHLIVKNYLPSQIIHAHANQINDSPSCLFNAKRKTIRPIIMGHFDRGCLLYQLLRNRPIIHLTMLRSPVKRILSHYRYLQGSVNHVKHQEVKGISLEQYASSTIKEIQNKQTLRILGDRSRAARIQSLNDPEPLFRAAKQVLEHEFSLFGLTEKYTQFLLMAKKVLNWEDIVYRRKNVSQKTVASDSDTEIIGAGKQGIKIIRERNQLDIKLYDFACELFEKRYQELNLKPQAEEQYEQSNQLYQSIINNMNNI